MDKENKALDNYLSDIGQAPLLTDEEERGLAERIKGGDAKAFDRLVTANLTFVVSLARQYVGRGVAVEDLVSEGNIGLMQAARDFDGSRGKRFVTFAAPYIRERLRRAIERQAGLYRVPRDASDPALERKRSRALSIDAPVGGSPELSLGRVIPDQDAPDPDRQLQDSALRDELARLVARLPEREGRVVGMTYGIGAPRLTFAEAGEVMGLSRERVRQIHKHAVRRLLRMTRNTHLRDYLTRS